MASIEQYITWNFAGVGFSITLFYQSYNTLTKDFPSELLHLARVLRTYFVSSCVSFGCLAICVELIIPNIPPVPAVSEGTATLLAIAVTTLHALVFFWILFVRLLLLRRKRALTILLASAAKRAGPEDLPLFARVASSCYSMRHSDEWTIAMNTLRLLTDRLLTLQPRPITAPPTIYDSVAETLNVLEHLDRSTSTAQMDQVLITYLSSIGRRASESGDNVLIERTVSVLHTLAGLQSQATPAAIPVACSALDTIGVLFELLVRNGNNGPASQVLRDLRHRIGQAGSQSGPLPPSLSSALVSSVVSTWFLCLSAARPDLASQCVEALNALAERADRASVYVILSQLDGMARSLPSNSSTSPTAFSLPILLALLRLADAGEYDETHLPKQQAIRACVRILESDPSEELLKEFLAGVQYSNNLPMLRANLAPLIAINVRTPPQDTVRGILASIAPQEDA
jgi:hypothetical protein